MSFPQVRMRRLRKTPALRTMMSQTQVRPSDLIYPIFVDESAKKPIPIESMPGYSRLPIDQVVDEARQALEQDIKAILLFGIPAKKDPIGTGAYVQDGIIQKTINKLKTEFNDELVLIADVCLCEYTSHGHCGILEGNDVQNDQTLKLLQKTALSQAQAGADMVAPSAMMDGQVKAIRTALDDGGFSQVSIMSYSAKFASGFYCPFREAAGSTPQFGNRKAYQMNNSNSKEALREIELDINEGADIIMVKPAMLYLDIIQLAKTKFNLPIAAYSVSGEYSMIKAAAQNGYIDEKTIALELLTSLKRAGSDLIITYFAKDVKTWLNQI
jgi:porphobilinogen synthase